jgi:predicted phosphodiesterase
MDVAARVARRVRPHLDAHRPEARLRRVEVFAVDDRSVQVVWGRAPDGPVHVFAGRRGWFVGGDGGPGGVVIDGLDPGAVVPVRVVAGRSEHVRLRARTLRPAGELLCRVATVSDTHVGAATFGVLRTMTDRSGYPEPTAFRCARRALRDAEAWQADLVVVKGDVTNYGWHSQWSDVTGLLEEVRVPTVVTVGNHDTDPMREVDPLPRLRDAGLTVADPLHVVDLPGVRVITVDSSRDARSTGSLAPVLDDLLDALSDADRPALVCVHHCFDRWPVPTKYPMGILWPESGRMLGAIRRAKPDVLVTSGHSHRNRARRFGPLMVTEVGSTKDYPGVWAGYSVFEGGIIQQVRRTTRPDAMRWTEYSRRAVGGAWGWYAPGRLADRCFAHRWPSPGAR